ncbi:MAG: FKBP-type peptidyl-prolyl cis-trans isomerase [Candidatus Hydrogenedentales bacterium]
MRRYLVAPMACVAVLAMAAAAPGQELETDKDKTSYSVGAQLGQMLSAGRDLLDAEIVLQGLRDSLEGKESKVDDETRHELLSKWQMQAQEAQRAEMEAQAEVMSAEGAAFLSENAKKEGVVTLPSGLQYEVLEEGSGKTPGPTDTVKAHYSGTLTDGTPFDSSYKRNEPFVTPVNRVIPGWTEALQLMKEGAKWRIYVPHNLAYGARGAPPAIPPYSTLIFEMELLEVMDAPAGAQPRQPQQ